MADGIEQLLRLGTRGSMLAVRQSQQVADTLMARHPGVRVELVRIQTTGDRVTDRPLHDIGGKGLFTKELQLALLAGEIDLAVHSMKDVPVTMPLVDDAELIIAAIPPREDPRDVLIVRNRLPLDVRQLARVGTTSLRRQCQLLEQNATLEIAPLRGNIDTRLRKLRDGEFDAIVLALAGLKRGGVFDEACMHPMSLDQMLPAPAQGALGIECRRDDAPTRAAIAVIDDAPTRRCVAIERDVVRRLNGDCHSPIAALAVLDGDTVRLRVAVGESGGRLPVRRADVAGTSDASIVDRAIAELV